MGLILSFAIHFLLLAPAWANVERTIEGKLPVLGSVRKFLELFIQPYIQFATRRSYQETLVDKVIKEKIEELKPLLQDNDDTHDAPDELKLEGNDETTIIEVVSKSDRENKHKKKKTNISKAYHKAVDHDQGNDDKIDVFKQNINRYKNMRRKILKRLQKESVSQKTEKYVAKSLDEMILGLVKNQCRWKSEPFPRTATRRTEYNSTTELSSQDWEEVKRHYANLLDNRNVKEALSFLHQSVDFFSKLSEVFDIKCKMADAQLNSTRVLRSVQNGTCDNFILCSQELGEFLKSYYVALNTSAVSAFRNYAEMYWLDVNNEASLEKTEVISTVNNVSNTVERIVSKMVRKEIIKLKLDATRNKDANIQILRDLIKNTGERVKKHVAQHLKTDLSSLRPIIVVNVMKDIDVNLRTDVESLQRKFTEEICKIFTSCNGNSVINAESKRRHFTDSKGVYFKVQLHFDDDMKNELARGNKAYFRDGIIDKSGMKRAVTRTTSALNTKYTSNFDTAIVDPVPRKQFKDTKNIIKDPSPYRVQLVDGKGRQLETVKVGNLTVNRNIGSNNNTAKLQFIDLNGI